VHFETRTVVALNQLGQLIANGMTTQVWRKIGNAYLVVTPTVRFPHQLWRLLHTLLRIVSSGSQLQSWVIEIAEEGKRIDGRFLFHYVHF
jgi:hypothetical protein